MRKLLVDTKGNLHIELNSKEKECICNNCKYNLSKSKAPLAMDCKIHKELLRINKIIPTIITNCPMFTPKTYYRTLSGGITEI